jgi:hypothetical protein
MRLTSNGTAIVDHAATVRCHEVVDVFPPTTLGVFDEKDSSYKMNFKAGVDIKFRIDPKKFNEFKLRREHPVGSHEYSPVIESISVHSSRELSDTADELPRLEVVPGEGVRVFRPSTSEAGWIELGSSLQDVLSALGPYDESTGDFYNFFKLGVDVKVNRSKYCAVEKIILHCNQPGHILFGRYSRSWFEVSEPTRRSKSKPAEPSGIPVNNESTLSELSDRIGEPGPPLVVNSPHSTAVQYFYTFKRGLTFELTPSGAIASLEICAQ